MCQYTTPFNFDEVYVLSKVKKYNCALFLIDFLLFSSISNIKYKEDKITSLLGHFYDPLTKSGRVLLTFITFT